MGFVSCAKHREHNDNNRINCIEKNQNIMKNMLPGKGVGWGSIFLLEMWIQQKDREIDRYTLFESV